MRTLVAWGAMNARPPNRTQPQVAFKLQYGGIFGPTCAAPYKGPPLAWLVAACTTPDGAHWALQAWQRMLPNYGVAPTPKQRPGSFGSRTGRERCPCSRSGPTGRTAASTTSTAGSPTRAEASSGSARLASASRSTPTGATSSSTRSNRVRPRLEEREQLPDALAAEVLLRVLSARAHPVGNGRKYRATVIGPGVTPDVTWQGLAPTPTTRRATRRRTRSSATPRQRCPLQDQLRPRGARRDLW